MGARHSTNQFSEAEMRVPGSKTITYKQIICSLEHALYSSFGDVFYHLAYFKKPGYSRLHEIKPMFKRTRQLTVPACAPFLVFAIACGQIPNNQAGDQTTQDRAAPPKSATNAWQDLPVADGKLKTLDIGNATVGMPGTPKPSVLDISISPAQHVLFDGLKYKGFIYLCISHSLEGDPASLHKDEGSVANALVERFRGLYSNLSSERESAPATLSLQLTSGTNRIGKFTFKSDGKGLVVLGVVSVSPENGWNGVVEQSFFESLRFKQTFSVLALVRSTRDLLVFSDISKTRFFLVPRLQFDTALPVLLDFQVEKDSVRFASSLVWPDVLGAPRDALREEFHQSGQTASLFRHDLAQVTVSLEVDNVVVHVWRDPGLKEDFQLTFQANQPQYEALHKLAGSAAVRDSAKLLMRADLIGYDAHIQYSENAFPEEVTLKIDQR